MIANFGRSLMTSLRIMSRNKVGFAGFLVTLLIVLVSFAAPLFFKMDMSAHADLIYQAPSAAHWLGTDYQGRDNFLQILTGGRDVIYVAFLAGVITVVIAVVFGSLAAVVGGWVDTILTGAAELVITIPSYPLLLVLAGFVRLNNPGGLAMIIAATHWGSLMLAIRSQVFSLKERDYVQAARALGLPTAHVLFREIIPNMASYILTALVMSMTGAIYSQVGLYFLGIVPMGDHSNWGVMFGLASRQGAIYGKSSIYFIMSPIVMIVILQYALYSMNRSLEELFNPRLRSGE
ncbi:MAG TPA: ABC transporter permease [Symbiobacteriaceae bacterium]|jgi:peptide/nickel transport system permease protein|nr:ABC transporter permease [Symbiobacteriaceae bacterium]